MMKRLSFLFMLIVGIVVMSGCKGDDPVNQPPQPAVKPEITLTEVEVTTESLTFEITTTIPGQAGYAVVADGYATPTIDEWFATNTVDVEQKATVVIDNLNSGTSYTLYVALRSAGDKVLSSPAVHKFTTVESEVTNPIVIDNISYNEVVFTINIPGNYLFQCIDKASLEYYEQTPESYISTLGIGIPSSGVQTYEWVDGLMFDAYEMRLRADSDYYIIAAISDGQQNVTGDVYVKEFRTLKKPESNAGVEVELSDITSTSVNVKTTPDADVREYYVWVCSKANIDKYIEVGGESILNTLIKNAASGSWHLNGANNAVWSGLVPNTVYQCLVHYTDNKGAEAMKVQEFTTLGSSMSAPEVDMSITEDSEEGYKTLFLNLYSAGAAHVRILFNTAADIAEMRAISDNESKMIASNGIELSADQVAAIASTGLSIRMENLWPETEYVAIVSVKNAEQTEVIVTDSYTTPKRPLPQRVESELFDSLLGTWKVSYSLIQYNMTKVSIDGVEVTIAAGADDKSSKEYRDHNRLVVLGWPFSVTAQGAYEPIPLMLPSDLMDASSYWRNSESLAYRDYGPKIFLEIAEGDVITVPTEKGTYLYHWDANNTVLNFYGCDYDNLMTAPATFPVTLSDDGNTLTIGAYVSGAEFGYGVYRPSVFRNDRDLWCVATSDIVLTRVE